MWATLHAFEHNNLDRMTQTRAPKYGHTLLRSRARKPQSAITLLKNSVRILWVSCSSRMDYQNPRFLGLRAWLHRNTPGASQLDCGTMHDPHVAFVDLPQ
jgi:hypothetical protein